ncbi:MAG: ribonuclease HII, partial [Candidatus Omnitrophica bacterium]|nr:ribonuclease HII [Candidatus Omnitrophota bacterium]
TIVQGDNIVLSIACASIIAKVTRDRILNVYDAIYPQYGFKRHKGYPTPQHKEAISTHGLSLIHRRSYKHS